MMSAILSFDEALKTLLQKAQRVQETEPVETMNANGRILAAVQYSSLSLPALDTSAMDGYALRVADVPAPGTVLPVSQRIPAGHVGTALQPGSAARIFTGAALPAGADAVVMQELCSLEGEQVTVNHLPWLGEAVRPAGSEVNAGAVLLSAGVCLRPQDIGLLASVGIARLRVFRRVRVALFSTGDELVMPGESLPPGGVYNSNRYQLRALLEQLGCEVSDFGIVPDRLETTRRILREAADGHDLILTSGGVSVGEEDHVKPAVEAEGALLLWKIAVKPGKPLAYGRIGGASFIGLPGNPVSSFVTFLMLVRPFILAMQGASRLEPRRLQMQAAFDWPKPDVRREFLRGRLNEEGRVILYDRQGSAVLSSTVWADGLIDVPPATPVRHGDMVRFIPYSELFGG